jgi:hypothetical protein
VAALTSNIVANQAIQLIGDKQPPITGNAPNFDSSKAGVACAALYPWVVRTVARQFGWDFTRTTAALAPSGNAAPFPWAFEYLYPPAAAQVWQLAPPALADPNNPLPVNWAVANTMVGPNQAKVIQCNLAGALAIFDNVPAESTWDPGFQEEVVRLLASELAMALAGKPDTAQGLLESASQIGGAMQERDS